MRKILKIIAPFALALLAFGFIISVAYAITWYTLHSTGTVNNLNDVFFASGSALNGWAVGASGTIIRTADQGATWTLQTSPNANSLHGVSFFDDNIGYAVGDSGTILKTVNGGTLWSAQTSGVATRLNAITVSSTSVTVYAVGDSGVILRTTDGGTNWTSQTSGIVTNLYAVAIRPTTNTVLVAAGAGGVILRGTTSGTVWAPKTSNTVNDLHGISYIDTGSVWGAGNGGTVITSTDNGNTWATQTSGTSENLNDIYINTNAANGWAVGENGTILATTNGGTNWAAETSGVTNHLRSVHFFNTTTGWIAGDTGLILASSDLAPAPAPAAPTGGADKKVPPDQPLLTIINHVINKDGGKATSADFDISIKIYGQNVAGSPAFGHELPEKIYQLDTTGTFTVSELPVSGYTVSYSGDCDSEGKIFLEFFDKKTCVVTNYYIGTTPQQPAPSEATSTVPTAPSVAKPSPIAQVVSPVFNKDLEFGRRDDDVRRLQELLTKDSDVYPEGLVTGYFGPLTQKAVRNFQKAHDLPQAGRVGPLTRAKLREVFSQE